MPVVTVNIPDPKADPMLKGLVREFAAIAKSLRERKPVETKVESSKDVSMLMRQQDTLLKTIERMMAMMVKLPKSQGLDLKDFKSAMSGVADELKSAIKSGYKSSSQRPSVTVNPEVKVNLGGLSKRLSGIEDALVANSKRGRNRTFGSNF